MLIYTNGQLQADDEVTLTAEQRERIDDWCDWLKTDQGMRYMADREQREETKLLRLLGSDQ